MWSIDRKPDTTSAEESTSAPARVGARSVAAHEPSPSQQAEPTRGGGGERAGDWAADGALLSAMGLGAPVVQRQASGPAGPAVLPAGGGGAPLPASARAPFERSLGQDLGEVRVHTGAESQQSAQALGAKAFTTQRDIHFAAGQYQPDTPAGQSLLAHEVAHAVQQSSGASPQAKLAASEPGDALAVSEPGDALEREADVAAVAMVRGAPAAVSRGAASAVQRQVPEDSAPDTTATTGGMCTPEDPDGTGGAIDPPSPATAQSGFIDHDDGSNIRNRPAELTGSITLTAAPLPPATRVQVTGRHPETSEWSYVTAFLPNSIVRGYVQGFRVTTELPEPTARLHQIAPGDTAEGLATQEFSSSVRDGHDLRYYENVLLHVNREAGRDGIRGEFQSPDLLGGGANNVQLVAGKRIWLVSAAYAAALESLVPDGSLTNGAVAGARRVLGHIEDILASVTESPQYAAEVAGEYLEAIQSHLPEIIGITSGFLLAEAASALLAATPTGVGQLVAVLIQLGLAAFGAVGLVEAGVQAIQHGQAWLTTAWTCNGNPALRAEASRSFLRMFVSIAMAALAFAGMRGNMGNALRIADNITIVPPSLGMPAMSTSGGAAVMGGPVFVPGSITSAGPVAISPVFMSGLSMGMGGVSWRARANSLEHRARTAREAAEALPDDAPNKWEMLQRARDLESEAAALRELAGASDEAASSLADDIADVERRIGELEREIVEATPVATPASSLPRPHQPHPANQLPVAGDHPYVPPRRAGNPELVRAPNGGGYLDEAGNVWEWARDPHGGPHWDVQHADGSHTNVYPDGIVHQGADNF